MTAHALNPENTIKSFKEGAILYMPKEKIIDIATYLSDNFEAKEKGKSLLRRWFDRFGAYYKNRLGPHWRTPEEEMCERLKKIKFEAWKNYYWQLD